MSFKTTLHPLHLLVTEALLGLSPTKLLQLLANYGESGTRFENCWGSENEDGWLDQSCVV